MDNLQAKYVSAKEVLTLCSTVKDNEDILNYIKGNGKEGLPQRLEEINKVLNGTPFTVSYRVMNELTIYLAVFHSPSPRRYALCEGSKWCYAPIFTISPH